MVFCYIHDVVQMKTRYKEKHFSSSEALSRRVYGDEYKKKKVQKINSKACKKESILMSNARVIGYELFLFVLKAYPENLFILLKLS